MGYGIFGYIEVKDSSEAEWNIYKELETVGRGWPVQLVFGYGSKTTDCVSLFKDRGLPIDASDEVREDYIEKQVHLGHNGEYRDMFGHSHAYSHELPQALVDKFDEFAEAAEKYDNARILVWFNR